MRLVTYDAGAGPRVGALEGHAVHDLGFDGDMVGFIAAGAPIGPRTPVAGDFRLLAPLRPRSLRDFLAFEGHMKAALTRLGRAIPPEWYDVPAYYKGMPDTVIGPGDEIPWPAWTDHLDHELELAAVIGPAPVRDLTPEAARSAIFGWTIWNDMSARDVQARELPIGMGPGKAKDWDGSNVLGPCIVTADELDGSDLRMTRPHQRRDLGRGIVGGDAPRLRRPDRLRLALTDPLPGRSDRLGHRTRGLGHRTRSPAGAGRCHRDGDRGHRRSQKHHRKERDLKWPTS